MTNSAPACSLSRITAHMEQPILLVSSPAASLRIEAARAFLRAHPRGTPALIVTPSPGAGLALVAEVLEPDAACFGWRRRTLEALADELALPELARARQNPVRRLGLEALCARVVHAQSDLNQLGRFSALRRRPGFVRALTSSLDELRLAGIGEAELELHDADMARLLAAYSAALRDARLADRARVFEVASARAALEPVPALVMLDVPLLHAAEAAFAVALGAQAGRVCVTVPLGDGRTRDAWLAGLGSRVREERRAPEGDDALRRLQRCLFETEPPVHTRLDPPGPLLGEQLGLFDAPQPRSPAADSGAPAIDSEAEATVSFGSSPGESRECVEVARAILVAADSGVPFDRIAVGVRAVENYRAVLEEALDRARIPAHFADGVRRPAPEGRAFHALLECAARGLSARSFAEYVSIGVMPSGIVGPQKWERLLVDAAVVGGRARWTRRLNGLGQSVADQAAELAADDPARERLEQEAAQLAALGEFAFPVLDALDALPRTATWSEWLEALDALARLSLREPAAVSDTLAELAPLGPVGPVTLSDVQRLLAARLRSLIVPSTGLGAGKVFVASVEELRGRTFARVFVVGLAEKVFPARISEDPLLPDRVRRLLARPPLLGSERVARERLALRLAIGAASERVRLSYPRFDLEHGRPRVPSFYGLEALQAICGELPAFDELARRADPGAAPRLGWPAPRDPSHAIDDAEFDVAVLEHWRAATEPNIGAARYLLQANPHLARALRFRARRWGARRYVAADGFVVTEEATRALLSTYALGTRAYSASALAQLSACPYKFYLAAVMRLAEPSRIAEIDELDARQRGVLFHAVQRDVVNTLRAAGFLPLTEASWPRARELLHDCVDRALASAREAYAPAIERVFDTALASLRSDLEQWLFKLTLDREWSPLRAELEFGFASGAQDAESELPVLLEPGLLLSGAVDLVEERTGGSEAEPRVLRATDHKTGVAPAKLGVTSGGKVLQPLLYALALERLYPDAAVAAGRLHFCTTRGRFEVQEVPLNPGTRQVAQRFVAATASMLDAGFLPAAPDRGACEGCSYRAICGPYEEERVAGVKAPDAARLSALFDIRSLP